MARKLPKWLTRREDGAFVADPDIAYPIVLKAAGVKDTELDQYWIETAYQCTKLAVQRLVLGTEYDPRPKMALVIVIESAGERKERWALRNYPVGKGIGRATKGGEAKALSYPRVEQALLAA